MIRKIFKFRLAGIFGFLAVIAVFSFAAMLLWNWLMPDIFALPALGYWQALGLVVLFRILFGGIEGGHFNRGGHEFHHGNALRTKWMNMSEEERKAFAEKEGDFRHFFYDRFSAQARAHGANTPNEGGKNE